MVAVSGYCQAGVLTMLTVTAALLRVAVAGDYLCPYSCLDLILLIC